MIMSTFAAEASLQTESRSYTGAPLHGQQDGRDTVTPQACVSPCLQVPYLDFGLRIRCCTRWGWPPIRCSFRGRC